MPIPFIPGIVSLLFCLGALPVVKRVAVRFNLYDAPGPLKIHSAPIARLGGAAMMAGFAAGAFSAHILTSRHQAPMFVLAAVWIVGLIDDVRSLGAVARFCVHIAAGATLWFAGWRLGWVSIPALDLILTCLFVAFLINAMNLLDGMDGLAAGTAAIICAGFLAISLADAAGLEAVVALSLLGACVGILSANAPPATIFMGDSGSTLIGIILAFLSLNWVRERPAQHSLLVPLFFLGVPLADAVLAILRRGRARTSLFSGDRRHYYDILLQRGLPVRSVFGISLGITAALVLTGYLVSRGLLAGTIAAAFALFGLIVAALALGSLRPDVTPVPADQRQSPLDPALD